MIVGEGVYLYMTSKATSGLIPKVESHKRNCAFNK